MSSSAQQDIPSPRSLAALWTAGERARHFEDPERIGTVVDANVHAAGVVRLRFPGSGSLECFMFFELESPDVAWGSGCRCSGCRYCNPCCCLNTVPRTAKQL